MEFLKVGKNGFYVVKGVGSLGMPGELDSLPWGEVTVDLRHGGLDGFLDGEKLFTDVDSVFF